MNEVQHQNDIQDGYCDDDMGFASRTAIVTDGIDGLRQRRRHLAWTMGWLGVSFAVLLAVSLNRADAHPMWCQSHLRCSMQPFEGMEDLKKFMRYQFRTPQNTVYTFDLVMTPPSDLDIINAQIARVRVCKLH